MDFPRKHIAGVYQKIGKTFGELIANFVVGSDETGLSGMEGAVSAVGSRGKSKYEKTNNDSRVSITICHKGSVACSNGPTAFLLPGKRKRKAYSNDFLVKHGTAHGSTIAMTESGYTTG